MRNNKFYINFFGSVMFFIGLILSIIITAKIYYFINPYNNNKLFSHNMLIAIKTYEVSYLELLKSKSVIRIMQFAVILFLLISKHRKKAYLLICLLAGLLCAFYGTIFYLEMGYKGIINLIIISFPHMIFYIASFLCLINHIIQKDNSIQETHTSNKLLTKAAPYLNILLLWIIGFLSETVINLFLVQKCFII